MILSAQTIRRRIKSPTVDEIIDGPLAINPFCERSVFAGMSFGLSSAGYDVRIKNEIMLRPGDFILATTVEYVAIPRDLLCKLADKSSWARRGIAVQNTIFEPGWRGYPTLEVSNHGRNRVRISAGAPIGQLLFHMLDYPTEQPYAGKYQDQPQEPVGACIE